jgi:gas vesicle protein
MDMTNPDPSPPQEQAIVRFIRRVAILVSIRYALMFMTIWGFLCGVAVLAMRAATGRPLIQLVWILAGIVPCAVIAILLALKRLPDRSAVRALLDNRNSCGGLLMASERAELGDWQARMPAIADPRLHWRARRPVAFVLASALFVAVSFLIPARSGLASDRPLDIAKEAGEISADIDVLEKEEIIDATHAELLETKLESITAEAKGEDPVKTWEALDHLQDTVSKTAEEAAERIAQNNERLAEAQALSETLADSGSGIDPKLMTEAMKELRAQMEAAAGDQEGGPTLPNDLLKDLKSGSLSREQLKQLADALKQHKGDISKRLGKLRDAGLIDLKRLKQCEKAGQCDSEGLAEFLKENAGNMTVTEMMNSWGRGGVDRGRGDAPMTWTDRSSERGAKFKEQVLPSSLAGLKDSELVGRSTGAPGIEKNGPQQAGALKGAAAGGGSAFTQTVLPRHRGAVNRYFERR